MTEKRVVPVPPADIQDFQRQERVAVVAGVAAYPPESSLSPLRYANADAQAIGAALRRQGYAVRLMVDQQATGSYVRKAIAEAAKLIRPGDGTLLFYFSGHGFAAQSKANYLATYGATADNIAEDGLALEEVQRIMDESKARRRVMWVDACRNDASGKAAGARSFADLSAAGGLRVLLSTRFGDTSHESPELSQGVFTYFLLRGLRGEAAGTDGLITFADLSKYVTESVKRWGFERGISQTPVERGEEVTGDFLIASAGAAAASGSSRPAAPPASAIVTVYTGPDPLGIDGSKVGKGVNFYSLEKEIALGKQLSMEAERSLRIVNDTAISEYVNRVGQNVVGNSFSSTPFTIKVAIADEVNAYALPGGYLYISTGLIRRTRTEAELAAIMAHLIAHVDAHHGTRQASKGNVASIAGVGGWAARAGAGSNTLIPPGFLIFSKEFEAEADRLALDYLAKCRYRAASLVEFFESLGPVAKSFESHPMTKERIAAAQRLLTQLGNRPDAIATTQEFEDMKARLVR